MSDRMAEALRALHEAAEALGHVLTDDAERALTAWAALTIEWRAAARLTALRTPESVLSELMAPALYALALLEVRADMHIVEFGCGSGCTGAALAAVHRGGSWHLVDRDEKKLTFCRYALRRCRIEQLDVLGVEEVRTQGIVPDVVLARGLPREGTALREAANLLGEHGVVLRWIAGASAPAGGTSVRCGDLDLWVVAQGRECFT